MDSAELLSRTRRQLVALAKSADIVGRHRMTKAELSQILAAWYSRRPAGTETGELPRSYGRSHLTLLEINPSLAHAFWELTPEDFRNASARLAAESASAVWVVRLHSVAADDALFDVEIDPAPGNWYVHHPYKGAACWAEIGLRIPSGQFVPLCRSNSIGSLHIELPEVSESELPSVEELSVQTVPEPTPVPALAPPPAVIPAPTDSENPKSAIRNPQSEGPVSSFECGLRAVPDHLEKA